MAFFYLINFNENWLFSSIVFGSCVIFQMYKSGFDLLGNEYVPLGLWSFFCVSIYTILAYRTEVLSKQSFLGKESSEKAFHRWMKIFETFPEGIALIRNNYILYANRSLKYILNVGINRSNKEDPLYELLR